MQPAYRFRLAFALVEYLKIPCLVRHSTSKFSVHVRSSRYRGKLSLTAIELSELTLLTRVLRPAARRLAFQPPPLSAKGSSQPRDLSLPYSIHIHSIGTRTPMFHTHVFGSKTFSSCCTSIYGKLLVHDTSLISFLPLLTSRTHTSRSFEFILAYISVQYSAAAFRSILLIQKCHLYGHFLSPRCRWLGYQSLKRLPNQVRPFTTKWPL